MIDRERHVRRFVFGRLLPIRGMKYKWDRRYGWHWVVQLKDVTLLGPDVWVDKEWLHGKPWDGRSPSLPP